MTRSLVVLSDWLRGLGVSRVVMEATSDYWKPPFSVLGAVARVAVRTRIPDLREAFESRFNAHHAFLLSGYSPVSTRSTRTSPRWRTGSRS